MFPGSRGSPVPSATSFWWAHCVATRRCRIRSTKQSFIRRRERHQSRRSLGARGEGQLPALQRSGIRIRAHRDVRRRGPPARQPARVSAQLLQSHCGKQLSEGQYDRPRRAFRRFRFLLAAALRAQLAHALHRLGGARRYLPDRRAAARRRASGDLSLACARHSRSSICAWKAAST